MSPVEAYTLYDGQLVPAGDWQLLLTGFCRKDTAQFKFRAMLLVAGLVYEHFIAVTFLTVLTVQHGGRTVAVCLCIRLKVVQKVSLS